uniref:Uncharacterized protein n=1 Tax=Proboscia inermis TaxID=420281 RepID=A0A7S0CLR7_9STRA|mmetsp:Transcript_6824/g.6979  ORF Transcript_6824/g.6979 Transcript_6824/m.6979 type:complete len:113 (+) Transcript_6824:33-371(+)
MKLLIYIYISNFTNDSNGYSIADADTNNSMASPNVVTTRKKVNVVLADSSLQQNGPKDNTSNILNKFSKKNGISKNNNTPSSSKSFLQKRHNGSNIVPVVGFHHLKNTHIVN